MTSRVRPASEVIATPAGAGDLLDDVLRAATAALGAEGGDIRLLDPESRTLSIIARQAEPDDPAGDAGRTDRDAASERALRTRQPVRIGDGGSDAQGSGVLAVPLLDRSGDPVGVLAASFRAADPAAAESTALESLHVRMAAELLAQARVEAALREREARYRSLFESIDEGFCTCEMIVDEDGRPVDYRFLEVNPLFGKMTGIRPEAVGRTARELVPDLEERWVERYAEVVLGGRPIRFEEGSAAMGRWFDVYAFPTGGREFAILFRDVTGRKKGEEALRSALAAKDDFLGLVSHELRTPMTVILGMSRLLSRATLDPATAGEVAAEIGDSAAELNALVESMLLLARLDHDETARLREPVLLNRAAETVLERHRDKDPSRSYRLQVDTPDTLVDVQGTLLEQVIDNLVINAAKYSEAGQPVTVIVDPEGETVRLRVLDEGNALTDEDLPKLFEPFYRAAGARQRATGAGLGLAVCHRIIELLGGRIWARRRPAGGAEFGFVLPLLSEEEL